MGASHPKSKGKNKARILVIDDDRAVVRALQMLLQYKGYWVVAAHDGIDGMDKAMIQNPDVILLDIVMPIMSGYEVARRLASHKATRHIPIIILSVKGQVRGVNPRDKRKIAKRVKEQITAYDAGAVAFLSKPVRAGELIEAIESATMRNLSALRDRPG